MFYTIVQVLLGIIYGLYLAFLAPASQRQKAHESLKQHTVVPTMQEKAMLSQIETSVAEPTTQRTVAPDILEDPKLAELAPAITEKQENSYLIATHPKLPKLLHPSRLDFQQNVKANSRKKTKPTTNKRAVAKTQTTAVVPACLTKMTVAQLRSLCIERNIKWRNAHGSRHLTKIEMLERLRA
jgi:hypothetical protein